jgi:hypothetical protein
MQTNNVALDFNRELAMDMASFSHDPLGHVMYSYPWGHGELEGFDGPEDWQKDLLIDVGNDLKRTANSSDRVHRYSVGSGNGIGKSAELGWLTNWGISTFTGCKIIVTANTGTQLRTKTWPEIAKWNNLFIAKHWFNFNATSITSVIPQLAITWRADAIPWSANNPAAFAGAHNKNKRLILLFDEGSEIDDIIYETIEGALTDSYTEILWFIFGNRTVNTGYFSRTFKEDRAFWNSRAIDSRTVKLSNKDQLQRWIDKYGIDSDWVRVHIKGEEPLSNPAQYIPQELITAARGKHLRSDQYSFASVIIGCDPAWKGGDSTVITLRQGLMSKVLWSIPKNEDDVLVANKLANFEDEYKADAVFIDLGYGTGIYSVGKNLGRDWQLIGYGEKAGKLGFLNKRAEMYGDLKDWLKEGGALEDHAQLCTELSWAETNPRLDGKIQLIDKDDMPASPNFSDSLALTFALPVVKKERIVEQQRQQQSASDNYDPNAWMN